MALASPQPFVFLLSFLLFFSSLSMISTTSTPTTPPTLVQITCNATSYYDFCVSSLQSQPDSPKAVDVKGLSSLAVTIAISNATNTSTFAASLADATSTKPPLRSVLRSCATKYRDARQALQWSLDALAADSYDYAFVHVSAAAEYPNVCRVLFRQTPTRLAYPPEMARREQDLEHLCTIALEIISLLG
ncbi:cell wall / vacuolar inhibitor of fructosidase 2-like [Zingiber officinale]|nr:cell wall / vacuolar inhibitor of fructosidase 2-like [Zingiber officinale]